MTESKEPGVEERPGFEWVFLAAPVGGAVMIANMLVMAVSLDLGRSAQGAMLVPALFPATTLMLAGAALSLILLGAYRGRKSRYPGLSEALWWLGILNTVWSLAQIPLFLSSL